MKKMKLLISYIIVAAMIITSGFMYDVKADASEIYNIIQNGSFDKDSGADLFGWNLGLSEEKTEENSVPVYSCDFNLDLDNWKASNTSTIVTNVEESDFDGKVMKIASISGSKKREVASEKITVEAGAKITVSLKVKSEEVDKLNILIREYKSDSTDSYNDNEIDVVAGEGSTVSLTKDYMCGTDTTMIDICVYAGKTYKKDFYIDDVAVVQKKSVGETTWSDGILSDNGNYKLKLSGNNKATYSGATFEEDEWYEYSFEAACKNESAGFTYGLLVDSVQKTTLEGLFKAKAGTTIGFFTKGTGEVYFDNLVVTKHEHKFEDIVNDSSFASEADCTHPEKHYKSCQACGTTGTETFTKGEALGHTTTFVEEDPATCTKDGVKAYHECTRCKEKFADVEATTPQTDDDLKLDKHTQTFHAAVPNSCTADGVKAYYECSCSKYYEDDACTKELKKEDLPVAKHNHKNAEKVDAKPASCTEVGNIEYWSCPDCDTNFTDEACTEVAETIVDPAKGHDVEYVAEVKATCTKDGKEAYYVCKNCENTFADKECKTEKTPQTIKKHTRKYYKKVSATYTKTGVNAHYKCSCGKYYTTSGKLTTLKSLTLAKTPVNKTKVTKVTGKSKALAIKWKKTSSVNGYEVQVALDKSFKKGLKKSTVKSAKTTSVTVKKLKAKKTYYVRVRTYKVVSGKKVYSSWTTVSKTKTK